MVDAVGMRCRAQLKGLRQWLITVGASIASIASTANAASIANIAINATSANN